MAKQLLEQFQEHPDAWKRVDGILEKSSMAESKVRFTFGFYGVPVRSLLPHTRNTNTLVYCFANFGKVDQDYVEGFAASTTTGCVFK